METINIPASDQLKPVPRIRVRTFFILHKHLNERILKDALDGLIRHHWRKLGARLTTRRKDGLLEYRLLHAFDDKYPLFRWSSKQHARSIDAIGLPKATPPEEGVALLSPVEEVDHWLSPSSEWPLELTEDPPDSPLLYVHFTTFDDGSCVAVNCPHVVGDQFGLSNIVRAWLGMTKGETPPPMLGGNHLAIGKSYADYRPEEVVRKGRIKVRHRGEHALVVMGVLPDMILHRKEEAHTLFFPSPLIESLRQRHSKTLTDKYGADPGISDNDIIAPILLKFARIHHTSPRTISLSQSVNLRGRLPSLQPPACNAFIHNALHYSTSRLLVTPSTPLSEMAYSSRRALNQALDPKDMEIGLVIMREQVRRGQMIHICEPFEQSFSVTSWTAVWKGLDFGSAFLVDDKAEEKEKQVEKGQRWSSSSELLVLGSSYLGPGRFLSTIMCKTVEGYWVNLKAPVKAMTLLKEYLKKDPMLEGL